MIFVLALAGCCPTFSFGSKGAPATPGAPSSPATPAPTPAKSGHVSGTIFGTDGKPLTLKGAKVKVGVSGVSSVGANVGFSPEVVDGHYDLKPATGLYQVRATMEYDWKGKHYIFDLHPVQDNKVSRDSEKGFVQDFVWKIQGPNRDAARDDNHTHWYGGTVNMVYAIYREDKKKGVPQPPAGTKAIFTFKPTGPLIDGSEAKTLTFERQFDGTLTGLTNNHCCDLPIGSYTITAVIQYPDGKKETAAIEQKYAVYGDSLEHTCEPDPYGKVWPRIVGFTREGP